MSDTESLVTASGGPVDPDEQVAAEVARIAASPEFVRAPVMRRLLAFLVRETLAGRGDSLKAYAVAVDGLGRAADFDAQTDSYPRVQVGRLRRMLDAYYARCDSVSGVRLSIPSGRYRVALELVEALSPPLAASAPELEQGAAPAIEPRRLSWPLIASVALLLAIAGAVMLFLLPPQRAAVPPGLAMAPSLVIGRLEGPRSLAAVTAETSAVLADGLRRSWLVRARTAGHGDDANAVEPDYRLDGDVTGRDQPSLRLRLFSQRTQELLWTGEAALPAGTPLRDALAPLVAELIQPYGVIATDQRSGLAAPPAPGHPCLLRADQYRRVRAPEMLAQVDSCLARTIAFDDHHGYALAARAMLRLDEAVFHLSPNWAATVARAGLDARRAVAADPYSPQAHLALGRTAMLADDCRVAGRHARRAIQLNPHDPDGLAIAANVLYGCRDPDTVSVAERALALEPNPVSMFYGPLLLEALDRGDVARALRLAEQMRPAGVTGAAELMRTVAAAAAGDRIAARAAWHQLAAVAPAIARDPLELLARWHVPEASRRRIGATLSRAGLPVRT